MPAIMEQVSRLSVSEKLNLMECILKSILFPSPNRLAEFGNGALD